MSLSLSDNLFYNLLIISVTNPKTVVKVSIISLIQLLVILENLLKVPTKVLIFILKTLIEFSHHHLYTQIHVYVILSTMFIFKMVMDNF